MIKGSSFLRLEDSFFLVIPLCFKGTGVYFTHLKIYLFCDSIHLLTKHKIMLDCIFCKIVRGEIPSYKVWEDENSFAFLDITPRSKGHTLVIPKVHAERISDLDEINASKLLPTVKKVVAKIQDKLNPDGYNIGFNDGKFGGQVVPHLHIHVMPRWEGDGGGSMHNIIKNPGETSVEELAKLFK